MRLLFVGDMPGAMQAWGGVARAAGSPQQASELLHTVRPDVLVVESLGWGAAWTAQIPPEERPPVLLVGPLQDGQVAPDEWVGSLDNRDELPLRLRLAVLRGRERRRTARRAMVDTLTGLPNRRAAIRGLVHAAARVKRAEGAVSLVLVDLDHFKTINDTFGHDAGDRVLRKVGSALTRVVRHDELCARIGGDEFALIVRGPIRAARSAARRVRSALLHVGVEATVAATQLQNGERLRDFYRRTDAILKGRKANRDAPTPPPASGLRTAA
jgi:diguanylate cyclase (GGDEF)-like protein